MGYSTDFYGKLILSSELDEVSEFNAFCEERHGGNLEPFEGMPGMWCNWETDGKTIYWNGGEKSYNMEEWLPILIEKFLKPNNITVSGKMFAQGEEPGDIWLLIVENNIVRTENLIDFDKLGITGLDE
jgi:hypothetical protein